MIWIIPAWSSFHVVSCLFVVGGYLFIYLFIMVMTECQVLLQLFFTLFFFFPFMKFSFYCDDQCHGSDC